MSFVLSVRKSYMRTPRRSLNQRLVELNINVSRDIFILRESCGEQVYQLLSLALSSLGHSVYRERI